MLAVISCAAALIIGGGIAILCLGIFSSRPRVAERIGQLDETRLLDKEERREVLEKQKGQHEETRIHLSSAIEDPNLQSALPYDEEVARDQATKPIDSSEITSDEFRKRTTHGVVVYREGIMRLVVGHHTNGQVRFALRQTPDGYRWKTDG
jgi:hypothetical protein